jgi:hypothetical protein
MTSRTAKMSMKPNQAAKCVEALRALYSAPLTPEEIAEKESAIAKVKAEDERKRQQADEDLFA